MNKRIEEHVNALFGDAPQNRRVLDIKEELLSNLNEKFSDLTAAGKSGDEAFGLTIESIGDIHSLIGGAGDTMTFESEKDRHVRGICVSAGAALYVLSFALLVLLNFFGVDNIIGFTAMLAVCAVATGFIVYGVSIGIGRAKYAKKNNTFVEKYREKAADGERRAKLRGAVSSAMWSLIVVVYLAFSFMTRLWAVSWIIFLLGACAQQFLVYCFAEPHRRKNLWHGVFWTLTVIAYFIISFAFGVWAWSWMIFLAGAAVEQAIRLAVLWGDKP